MKNPVTFLGMQEAGDGRPDLLLVNDAAGLTITFDPEKHVIVDRETG